MIAQIFEINARNHWAPESLLKVGITLWNQKTRQPIRIDTAALENQTDLDSMFQDVSY